MTSSNTDASPKTQAQRLKQFLIINGTIKKKYKPPNKKTKTKHNHHPKKPQACLKVMYLPVPDRKKELGISDEGSDGQSL